MDAHALWAALGRPQLTALLPLGSSEQWRAARALLNLAVPLAPRTMQSPTALWRTLHGGTPPRGATWAALLTDGDYTALQDPPRHSGQRGSIRLASWNARWIVDLSSATVARKRAAVGRQLRAGRVLLIQETHWDGAAAAVWGGGVFPHCRVIASPATAGPGGGPQGGGRHPLPRPVPVWAWENPRPRMRRVGRSNWDGRGVPHHRLPVSPPRQARRGCSRP